MPEIWDSPPPSSCPVHRVGQGGGGHWAGYNWVIDYKIFVANLLTFCVIQQNDVEKMKLRFTKVVMSNVYPLHFLSSMKPFMISDNLALQVRYVKTVIYIINFIISDNLTLQVSYMKTVIYTTLTLSYLMIWTLTFLKVHEDCYNI